jgi:hypothetical protein
LNRKRRARVVEVFIFNFKRNPSNRKSIGRLRRAKEEK